MSDQHDGPLSELTSEQEEAVRRLLAEARHEDPLPAAVADRLDRVLADLSSPSARAAPVVDLAARRRRRNAGRLLVAAAAVIVGGVAVGQMIGVSNPDSDDDSAGSSVERDTSSGGDGGGMSADQPVPEAAKSEPLRLTSQNLQHEVQRQLRRGTVADIEPGANAQSQADGGELACASAPPPAYGLGEFFAAIYDGTPAVLALRPPVGGTQEAQVLECGTGTPLQSVTVPAP